MASMSPANASFACGRLSLKDGVSSPFSTEKGSAVRCTACTCIATMHGDVPRSRRSCSTLRGQENSDNTPSATTHSLRAASQPETRARLLKPRQSALTQRYDGPCFAFIRILWLIATSVPWARPNHSLFVREFKGINLCRLQSSHAVVPA